ncbi:ABC transporter substrate-binding protein [Paenibacillus sp. BC26]|uniref:ABC transporter substrate-binding protein n=1 Tax=Paenibacillus sp. BC26 TaxID=1881032 RepID=UPI0008F3FA60|nr:extracellular solute-binding protein [Paenibacillus sp. BC26]SFS85400.1 ABC-type glycerol-3-phosphate transport system, substrate-binding protein [Paenibacillus sp. BC26]
MSRRKYVMLLLCVFTICAALLVPMIGKPGSPVTHSDDGPLSADKPQVVDGDEQDRTTLSIAVSMDEAEYRYWQGENEHFSLSHPQITIQMTNIHNEDADEARKKASENGEPFDLMLLDNDRVREFAVQGFLLPVDDIVSGDTAADQMEALTSMVKWNGSLWGVPLDCNPLLVVWQKNLLKAAGLSAPPKDLEELKATVATLVATNPNLSPFNLNTNDPKEMAAWMGMFKENSEAAANLSPFTITQKEQLYFAAEYAAQIYRLAPAQQKNQLLGAFGAGTLMSAVMPWTLYRSLSDEERGLLAIGSTTGPVVRANGRSFVMLAGTERLSEASAYITEMTSTEAQLDHYRTLGRLPSRISAMTNEFEYNDIDQRPPHFLVGMLSRTSVTPDPAWRGRWERWSKLLATLGGNQTALTPELAGTFISNWNEEPEQPIGDAEAPPEDPSKTDAKLNQ